jgi:hypothetical protein
MRAITIVHPCIPSLHGDIDTRLVSYLSSVPVSFRLKQLLNLGFEAIGCLRQPQRLITVAANHGLTALGVGLPRSHSGHRVVVVAWFLLAS